MKIRQLLSEKSANYAAKPSIIFKEQVTTFRDLEREALSLANAFKGLGVKKGDRIAIYLPNCPEYVCCYLAGFCLGAVIVPLDYLLTMDELVSCLTHCEAKLLIAQPKPDLDFEELSRQVGQLEKIIFHHPSEGEMNSLTQLIRKADVNLAEIEIDDNDPALIMYTSGTTGQPKGILLNYKHLDGSPKAMEHFVDLSDRDVKLTAIPLSHVGGFIYIQNCLQFGITLILMERFNPFEFLKNIQTYHVTCFHIVPPMYTALLTLKQIEKFDLSSLRWVVVFGAPSSPEILERFHKYCPNAQLLNGWGMTETCPPNTVTPLGSRNIASVGKPSADCQIKIVDEHGREVKAGEVGEVIISSPYLMDSYYKDPEATALTLKSGWLFTGDLGRFDEEGFLYIVGRKKEMIKVAGQIVYGPEVEAVFYRHPSVAEAAVIGIPDQIRGEAVKVFVVLRAGAEVSVEDLRYFIREHLAHFKVPQSVEIVKELPKNRIGKIDKQALKPTP